MQKATTNLPLSYGGGSILASTHNPIPALQVFAKADEQEPLSPG